MTTDPFDIVPDRQMLTARVRSSKGRVLTEVGARVVKTLEQSDEYGYGLIPAALQEVIALCEDAETPRDTHYLPEIGRLSDAAAGLLVRFTNHSAWDDYPVIRATCDGDPRAYLMHLALSPAMLIGVLIGTRLVGLSQVPKILLDPRLTPRQMAEEILHGGPRSHLAISHACFAGAPLDQGEARFYHTLREPGFHQAVYDFETGTKILPIDDDPDFADALVAALNAKPDVAAQIVDWAQRLERQRQSAYATMHGRPSEHGRTPESLALDPLYAERDPLIIAAIGAEAYSAYRGGVDARTEAWASGQPAQ